LEAEVDEITNLERALRPLLVGLSRHTLLCSQQMLANRGEHGGTPSANIVATSGTGEADLSVIPK